jgi:hypothetical protein
VKLRGAYDLQLAEVAVRQMRGVPATWVLPLEKSLGNWLTHSTAMEQDMTHGHYISRTYHQSGKMEASRGLSTALNSQWVNSGG